MYDDKCPTCPMYGKGYCNCGKSKIASKTKGTLLIILIALLLIAFAIGLNN